MLAQLSLGSHQETPLVNYVFCFVLFLLMVTYCLFVSAHLPIASESEHDFALQNFTEITVTISRYLEQFSSLCQRFLYNADNF